MNIILVIGLPGSGKTYYCNNLDSSRFNVFDDIETLDNLPATDDQRILVLSSPRFCYPGILRLCKEYLLKQYDGCVIECIYFENAPAKCLKNVVYRNDGRRVENTITSMSKYYKIPSGIIPLIIWQGDEI